jgi:hypothetical protein
MKNYKNYLIAILTGLLVLTLTTQPSIGAGKSKEAKSIEYDNCIRYSLSQLDAKRLGVSEEVALQTVITFCKKYQP